MSLISAALPYAKPLRMFALMTFARFAVLLAGSQLLLAAVVSAQQRDDFVTTPTPITAPSTFVKVPSVRDAVKRQRRPTPSARPAALALPAQTSVLTIADFNYPEPLAGYAAMSARLSAEDKQLLRSQIRDVSKRP
jgi:hypothetical protein